MDMSKYLKKEIKIPEILDRATMAIYQYPVAISSGIAHTIVESPLVHLIRKNLRPDMGNENWGNFIQRFKYGYRIGKDAFTYHSE